MISIKTLLIFLVLLFTISGKGQTVKRSEELSRRYRLGLSGGFGASYTDKALLFNLPAAISIEYRLGRSFWLEFAPEYSWLIRWNEHYLVLPLHLRVEIMQNVSAFAGPAFVFDLGYFRDLGLSAGVSNPINHRNSVSISAFTFTLYDYHIDYLYIPVTLMYRFTF